VLATVGVAEFFIENFDREGIAYVIIWLGISIPLGWVLGLLVTLADFVRPTE
jgi:predicted permease